MAPRRSRLLAAAAVAAATTALAGCGGSIPLRTVAGPLPTVPSPSTSEPTTGTTPTTTPGSTPVQKPARVTAPELSDPHSGTTLLRKALADAAAERWVHDVAAVPGAAGEPTTHFTSDDGPTRGTQEIRIGPLDGDIRVLGDRTWVEGVPQTLVDLFGIPAQSAEQLGGRWVTLRKADQEYASVTAGVTLTSLFGEVAFSGRVVAGTAVVDGTRRSAVEGRLAASVGTGEGVLYLTSGSRPLPLLWEQIGSNGTARSTFSRWGQVATVTAPGGAVSLPSSDGGATTSSSPAGGVAPQARSSVA